LQKRLSEPKLRILDARARADYEKGHIPGAVWLDGKALQELVRPETFTDRTAWERVLTPLGIEPDSAVFVYDNALQHDAARAWWLLSYVGVEHVGLIDGGYSLWEHDKRPVTSEVSSPSPRSFTPHFRAERVASQADVRSALASRDSLLLDARSGAEYRGEAKPQRAGNRPGQIPTARSFEAYAVVDTDGRFLNPTLQQERLGKAGVASGRSIIVYSAGGARSALLTFALDRLSIPSRHYVFGFTEWSKDASRHYVFGFTEWSKDASAPIATGAEPGAAAR
jgi:thiosulfate/3-mercaptopyruvate sulfurtransferase